jgi:hypothetical protein
MPTENGSVGCAPFKPDSGVSLGKKKRERVRNRGGERKREIVACLNEK